MRGRVRQRVQCLGKLLGNIFAPCRSLLGMASRQGTGSNLKRLFRFEHNEHEKITFRKRHHHNWYLPLYPRPRRFFLVPGAPRQKEKLTPLHPRFDILTPDRQPPTTIFDSDSSSRKQSEVGIFDRFFSCFGASAGNSRLDFDIFAGTTKYRTLCRAHKRTKHGHGKETPFLSRVRRERVSLRASAVRPLCVGRPGGRTYSDARCGLRGATSAVAATAAAATGVDLA